MKNEKMNLDSKRTMLITSLVTVIPIIIGIILYNKLPKELPIHFNGQWEPDGYLDKNIVITAFPLGLLILNLIAQLGIISDSKKNSSPVVTKRIMTWIIPMVSILVLSLTYVYGMGYTNWIQIILPLAMGVIFMMVGNYLPKCRQNRMMGIRLPWTLNNEEVWRKTHRIGGFTWVIGGALMIICSIVRFNYMILVIVEAILIILLPLIYSYVVHINEKK